MIPNSPADLAGLLPYGDYIIGTPEGSLRGESGLVELVEDYLSRPLRLYVYNHEYNVTRLLTITPSRNWGGEGALGCVLGYGALHQIPSPLDEPPAAEGDTLFENAHLSTDAPAYPAYNSNPQISDIASPPPPREPNPYNSPDLIQGAAMPAPPPLLSVTSTLPTRVPRKGRASPARGFDEMFAEGEQKSKEQDFAPTSKGAGLPPPPKAGLAPPPPSGLARSPSPAVSESGVSESDGE